MFERQNVEIIESTKSSSKLQEFHIKYRDLQFVAYCKILNTPLFIIDNSIDNISPNARLIIEKDYNNPLRKWDAILSQDYGIELERIRPKKDTKYQKLEIEYNGLNLYAELVNLLSNSDSDDIAIKSCYNKLIALKIQTALVNTKKRIEEASSEISKSNLTIKTTQTSIAKINEIINFFSQRLVMQKQQSKTVNNSSKIKNTIENIDRNKLKLSKSEKRLKHAIKRFENNTNELQNAKLRLEMLEKLNSEYLDNNDDINKNNGIEPVINLEPNITNLNTVGNVVSLSSNSDNTHKSNNNQNTEHNLAELVPPVILNDTEDSNVIIKKEDKTDKPLTIKDFEAPESMFKSFLYYALLIILIALSIFTLQLYKQKFLIEPQLELETLRQTKNSSNNTQIQPYKINNEVDSVIIDSDETNDNILSDQDNETQENPNDNIVIISEDETIQKIDTIHADFPENRIQNENLLHNDNVNTINKRAFQVEGPYINRKYIKVETNEY